MEKLLAAIEALMPLYCVHNGEEIRMKLVEFKSIEPSISVYTYRCEKCKRQAKLHVHVADVQKVAESFTSKTPDYAS